LPCPGESIVPTLSQPASNSLAASPLSAALFASLIDYAGLFPPAALSMSDAIRNYAAYRSGPHRDLLARFIVPANRLSEFAGLALPFVSAGSANDRWPLSILAPQASPEEAVAISAFQSEHSAFFTADVIETKSSAPADVARVLAAFDPDSTVFVEVPLDNQLDPHLDAIAAHKAFAKVRTGGLTPELFVPPLTLARFLHACAQRQLAFKATAGLHHLLPATRPLTYAPDSPCGPMHGFLNLFAAAALLHAHPGRLSLDETAALLSASSLSDAGMSITADSITYRGLAVNAAQASASRRHFALGFGSCSFDEPIADLQQAGLL
jgi:hypothetical protein